MGGIDGIKQLQKHQKWQEYRRTNTDKAATKGPQRTLPAWTSRQSRCQGRRRSAHVLAKYLLWNVEKEWKKQQMEIHIDRRQGRSYQVSSIPWADNHWVMPHSEKHLEQLMKELIEEAKRWNLEPMSASSWWSSTYVMGQGARDSKDRGDSRQSSISEKLQPSGIPLQSDSVEERLQEASEAWRRDARIYRSRDVPWRIKCKRMMDQVYSFEGWGSTAKKSRSEWCLFLPMTTCAQSL